MDAHAEKDTVNSTPGAQISKGTEAVPESSMTGKGSAIRRVTLVVSFVCP